MSTTENAAPISKAGRRSAAARDPGSPRQSRDPAHWRTSPMREHQDPRPRRPAALLLLLSFAHDGLESGAPLRTSLLVVAMMPSWDWSFATTRDQFKSPAVFQQLSGSLVFTESSFQKRKTLIATSLPRRKMLGHVGQLHPPYDRRRLRGGGHLLVVVSRGKGRGFTVVRCLVPIRGDDAFAPSHAGWLMIPAGVHGHLHSSSPAYRTSIPISRASSTAAASRS